MRSGHKTKKRKQWSVILRADSNFPAWRRGLDVISRAIE